MKTLAAKKHLTRWPDAPQGPKFGAKRVAGGRRGAGAIHSAVREGGLHSAAAKRTSETSSAAVIDCSGVRDGWPG